MANRLGSTNALLEAMHVDDQPLGGDQSCG